MKPDVNHTVISSIGWGIEIGSDSLFSRLDHLYALGFRKLECAANYPLCGLPQYFRHTENVILEWIRRSGVSDMELFIRIGSVENRLHAGTVNLSRSFLLMLMDDYLYKFGTNLTCVIPDNMDKSTLSGFQEALVALGPYYFNRSVCIGIDQSPRLNGFLDELEESGITPVLFIQPEQPLDITRIHQTRLADLYIDTRALSRSVASENPGMAEQMILEEVIKRIEAMVRTFSLPLNPGIVLSVENTFLLDSMISH
jgi:hypothetical protein